MPCALLDSSSTVHLKTNTHDSGRWVVDTTAHSTPEVTYSGMETLIAGVFLLSLPVILTAVAE